MQALLTWATAHPEWAGVAVFLVSLAESLAFIGIIVPGVAMMFVAGAMVGNGALAFWPVCFWAIAGAVAGDGLSYWLGAHYKQRMHRFWPFNRRPDLLEKGEVFFQKYGAYSIFLGRFFGPVRATIPVVAGMLSMPSQRFFINNIGSALVWAPVYLLPGVVFGASLDIVGRVAGRLVILLLLVVAVLFIFIWVTTFIYNFLRPYAVNGINGYFIWSSQHPFLVKLSHPLLNPDQRDHLSLLFIAFFLMLLGWFLAPWLEIEASLAHLRVSGLDQWILSLNALFSDLGCFLLVICISACLYSRSNSSALMHWLLVLLVSIMAGGFAELIDADHVVLRAVLICGAMAILVADSFRQARLAFLPYVLASCFCALMVVAQLYLGFAKLGQLLLIAFLATLWLCFLGMAYHRHRSKPVSRQQAAVSVLVFTLVAVLLVLFKQEQPVVDQSEIISDQQWQTQQWREFAVYRENWLGEAQQLLNIQWGDSLRTINRLLESSGWKKIETAGFKTLLMGLNTKAESSVLPVLPQLLQGEAEAAVWLFSEPADKQRFLILRLWATDKKLQTNDCQLWIGRLAWIERHDYFNVWAFMDELADDTAALNSFKQSFAIPALENVIERKTDRNEEIELISSCSN